MKAAIIGGTGHALPDYLKNAQEIQVNTPFGKPDPIIYYGTYDGDVFTPILGEFRSYEGVPGAQGITTHGELWLVDPDGNKLGNAPITGTDLVDIYGLPIPDLNNVEMSQVIDAEGRIRVQVSDIRYGVSQQVIDTEHAGYAGLVVEKYEGYLDDTGAFVATKRTVSEYDNEDWRIYNVASSANTYT